MKLNLTAAVALLLAVAGTPAVAATYIQDNFATFASGNLVGQNGWTQLGASSSLPLQVSGGNVIIPGNQSADNQDAAKSFGSTVTETIYAGMSLNVSSAPTSGASYFFALLESSGGFANARVAAVDNSANVPGTYLLEARYTGQGGNPFVVGTTPLLYGQTYNLVGKAIVTPTGAGEGIQLYINPTNNDESQQVPYLDTVPSTTTGFIIPPVGFTGAVISQFANATTHNTGLAIDHLYVANTFAEAAAVVPEPSSLVLAGVAGTIGLWTLRRRRK